MPLDRLVLIIVGVIAAAGATIWIATLLVASTQLGGLFGLMLILPFALIAYVVVRIISERVNNREDDHYDGIEK